jgi:transcriptional regulator with XRE-family HTH domain
MSRKKLIENKKICERIKQLRLNSSITGIKFSNSVGISQGYLSDIENGKAMPSKTILFALSYIYNINYDWLLTGEGEMTRVKNITPIYKVEKSEVDPETNELLNKAMAVLDSKTNYAQVLSVSI